MKKIIQAIARFFRRLFRIKPRFTVRYAPNEPRIEQESEFMPVLKNTPGGRHYVFYEWQLGRFVRRPGTVK